MFLSPRKAVAFMIMDWTVLFLNTVYKVRLALLLF
jgi:hypothetical protein